MTHPLIIGLGSSHGDDQAGWLVIDFLHSLGADEGSARKAAHPADILNWAEASRRLTICDAGNASGQPGRIGHWAWPDDRLAPSRLCGTHDMPLDDVLGLGYLSTCCPDRVDIWTIEGGMFSPMTPVTPAVAESARQVAEAIWQRQWSARDA